MLTQIVEQWKEVLGAARELLAHCPGGCETAWYDCLRDYYNVMHHRYLDRHLALEVMVDYDGALQAVAESPAVEPVRQSAALGPLILRSTGRPSS